MSTKFVRFVAALVVVVSIVGSTGVAGGARGAPPSVSAQNLEPPRGHETQPRDIPALDIPPASSLGVQFVHVATAANIVGYRTIIDHPLTNGKPGAIILVTPNFNPGGVVGPYEDHPISVVYYSGSQWAIFNQDLAAMPVGAAFNVIIPTAGANVFVHTATAGNSYFNHTYIDNALTNGNPNAIVFVTPNWNPGGVGGMYANFPIGVYYDTLASKWAIFNQNNTPDSMPVNASFNVFVPTAGTGVFVHTATAGNSGGDWTSIDNPLTNGNPNAIVFVTPNWNPGGTIGGTYDNHNIGVYYGGGKWRIFNQDWAAVPVNAAFNVLVLVPASDIFVHTATVTNSGGDWTKIDNALTNGHPNAIVFVTPNFNPGGGAGTTNPHPINVWYTGSQWAISNQDGSTAIPVHAAFNVLVPNPDTRVFVHKATVANSSGDYTIIDHPLTNGNPDAIIFVTPNYNPGGVGGTVDPHPIGVGYLGGKWFILNEDLADMPVNAAFNVFVPTAGPGIFVHTATADNIYSDYTIIDNPLTNGNPNAIVFVTPNVVTINSHPINVWYGDSKWAISNQDPAAAMPIFASFHVYVVPRYKLNLPLILR